MSDPADLWIFGYGSLMWRPDFPFVERAPARIEGYHRAFCIYSTHHRGTPRRPGLVLGLDRGRICVGVAYRVPPEHQAATLAYLRERELIYGVYREGRVAAALERASGWDHRAVLAYVAERRHPNYAGALPLSRQAAIIRGAQGGSGDNLDYLINTVRHLRELGIRERALERLVGIAGPVFARAQGQSLARPSVAGLRAACARTHAAVQPISKADQRRFGHRARLTVAW